ncbi:MAG: energy-coupling factor transporter transmembrane protein EcfT [Bacillota bacterium]|jgi:energy-coupling factor transport system permease protein|nr:energy-coupling factor transporter transmembrane protein EcfT [Bacillota bacterium]
MSRSITLGQYLPGESFIHLLNPRLKIITLLAMLVLLFTMQTMTGLLILLIFALLLFAISKIPFRYFLRSLRPIMMIALFALIIYFFFTKGGVVLLRIGSVTVESDGVTQGIFIITRLFTLILFSLLVTLTTTPLSLTYGMGYFLKPFNRLGLPTEEVAMIMAVALRFIPTLMEESQRLMRAQLSRGADFETGSIFRKAKSMVPLIVPLFISAFRRADELALAMEARGYRIGAKRTRLQRDLITFRDWAALISVLVLLMIALVYNF